MTAAAAVKSSCLTTNCISMCMMNAMTESWLNRSLIKQFKRQNLLNCQDLCWLGL